MKIAKLKSDKLAQIAFLSKRVSTSKLFFILLVFLLNKNGYAQKNIPSKRLVYAACREYSSAHGRAIDTFYIMPSAEHSLFAQHFFINNKPCYVLKEMPALYAALPSFEQKARSLATQTKWIVAYNYTKEKKRLGLSFWHPFTGGMNRFIFEKKGKQLQLISKEEGAF